MSEYNHREIESNWQRFWDENQTYRVDTQTGKPKYYVLDMFPYPSGAGLHVGHPLGYIASDIYSRYKRLKGFNVLHPMGFDSFGLPAEQYAIQTGQHPAITTEQNIARYIEQLKNIGFSYDWSREVRTSDPGYYRWTQWIFMELFRSWYNNDTNKAEPIETLLAQFEVKGNGQVNAPCDEDTPIFTAEEWRVMSEEEQYQISLKYRLTYVADATVNWCAGLGSVLSNDEVKDGVSERGGFPVEQKLMRQWMMRITAYAQRLLDGLDGLDWTESLKEQQRNWIGRSVGALVKFAVDQHPDRTIEVFTTRVDTIYGVTFMVLAPEHELVAEITTPEQQGEIDAYLDQTKKKSERDRMADVKTVSGAFTGAYAINPFNGEKIPVYIADYVLAGYGTGAVMAVPSGDQRDWNFARHFGLPIVPILDAQKDTEKEADATKEGRYINSGIVNGMGYKEATTTLINWLEEKGLGKGKINYRLRDAVFSRQRYWGEPVPVYYKDGVPYLIEESELPLELPAVDKYLPTESGEPPLGRAEGWKYQREYEYELSTMPGWAGSSWYWYRYMDPQNGENFASDEAINYWRNVDLYIGGTEHATGHLLYSRFWNKFLKDRGYVPEEEPFKKLINQGMIQGRSSFVYRVKSNDYSKPVFVSAGLRDRYEVTPLHVDVNIVENDVLDIEKFKATRLDIAGENAEFILEESGSLQGKYVCGVEVEKMSKSKFNVVNPDDIVVRYGADTLRLYEMFLGPLEQAKPWNTNGIDGTFRFIRKFWRLFYNDNGQWLVTEEAPKAEELRVLHKTIKKVEEDIEHFSFNTAVSAFMVCVNELSSLKCHKKAILQELVVLLSSYAPHISEELWAALGNEKGTVSKADFPKWEQQYVVDDVFEYPIQINGKVRTTLPFALDTAPPDIEKEVLANEIVQRWLEGKTPKKVIVVPKRIVNVVI
ncbi:leucine--tRNA ligase [Telluribacter humicola]|uniref:leucine--tRNA ligase n=1 Tax=Telluribacter humicola TaxID=1720261 RepID=UPI001A967CAB|nr:leucine--tRNA ligase [Telluribacter humicola]